MGSIASPRDRRLSGAGDRLQGHPTVVWDIVLDQGLASLGWHDAGLWPGCSGGAGGEWSEGSGSRAILDDAAGRNFAARNRKERDLPGWTGRRVYDRRPAHS